MQREGYCAIVVELVEEFSAIKAKILAHPDLEKSCVQYALMWLFTEAVDAAQLKLDAANKALREATAQAVPVRQPSVEDEF